MRALRSTLSLLLLITACAPISAQNARSRSSLTPSFASSQGSLRLIKERPDAPPFSGEIEQVLNDFPEQAQHQRELADSDRPMSECELRNWLAFIGRLDGFLARPAYETSPDKLVNLRQVMEAELERDSRVYSEVPVEIVDSVLDRIDRLAARLVEVRQLRERSAAQRERKVPFTWPVKPVFVTSPFGTRRQPITKMYAPHQGIDLAASRGQRVTAAGDGIVVRAEYGSGHGNHVDVDHGEGVMTRYSHLASILVEPGSALKQGDVLGLAGETGRTTGVHLHFEFWRNGLAVDPLTELVLPEDGLPMANR